MFYNINRIDFRMFFIDIFSTLNDRGQLLTDADIFKAQIVDITPELYILQYVDTSFEVDRFLKAVSEQAEVVETVRSGVCGIFRGEHSLHS